MLVVVTATLWYTPWSGGCSPQAHRQTLHQSPAREGMWDSMTLWCCWYIIHDTLMRKQVSPAFSLILSALVATCNWFKNASLLVLETTLTISEAHKRHEAAPSWRLCAPDYFKQILGNRIWFHGPWNHELPNTGLASIRGNAALTNMNTVSYDSMSLQSKRISKLYI